MTHLVRVLGTTSRAITAVLTRGQYEGWAARRELGAYARGPRWATCVPVDASLTLLATEWLRLHGPQTADALEAQLPVDPKRLGDALRALERAGHVTCTKDRYALVVEGPRS